MTNTTYRGLTWSHQVFLAAAVAGVGLIVSFAMRHSNWSAEPYLPDGSSFHVCAFIGAGVAGLIFARAFGHAGVLGYALSAGAALLMTVVGAEIGSLLAQAIDASPSGTLGLGTIALTLGVYQPSIFAVWICTMIFIHVLAHRFRGVSARRNWIMPS